MRSRALAAARSALIIGIAVGAAALLGTGCGAPAPALRPTVQTCAANGAQAIRRHITVTSIPASCRGLSPEQVGHAVGDAIRDVTGGEPKAVERHRAALASADLGYLITAVRQAEAKAAAAARARSRRSRPATAVSVPGRRIPIAVATLIAWLLTALSGGYLLAGWLRHGGMRRARTRSAGLPPAVILSHFGFAISGLVVWAAYLVTGAAPVAWAAAGLLLPVTGLGMATLLLAIPDSPPAASGLTPRRAGGPPVLMITVHGIFAIVTLLLVLLAAIAAG